MDRDKMLEVTLQQIEKQYGKGAVMKLGEHPMNAEITVIPTGSLALDIALGIGGIPRGRVVEVFGPEGSGKTTVCLHIIAEAQQQGGIAAFIDAEHALDPTYARALGVNIDELLVSQPDSGEQALEIADMLVRSGALSPGRDRLGGRARAARRDRGRDGRHPRRTAGAADVPGDAEALRLAVEVRDDRDLHQPAAREDRRDVRLARDHPGWPRAEVLLLGPAGRPQDREPQGRHRRRRLAHPRQGGEEQGRAAVPPVRVRHHVRQGHLQGGLAARRRRRSRDRQEVRRLVHLRGRAARAGQGERPRRSSPSTPTSATRSRRKVRRRSA